MQSVMQIEKLKGRENYDIWKLAAKSYLVIKGLWKCVDPPQVESNGSTTTATVNPDEDLKARSELTLLLHPINYSHVEEATSAKEAWDNLKNAFADSGTCRRVDTLQRLVTLKLADCSSMEDYISKMMKYWIKVKTVGFKIESEIVGSLMLGGLPKEYRPMVLGIENSGKTLTADYVKTILLQDVPFGRRVGGEDSAFVAKPKKNWPKKKNDDGDSRNKSKVQCFECQGYGHFARKCPNRTQKPRNAENSNVLYTSFHANASSDDWIIDSGCSAHMTMKKQSLLNLRDVKNKSVTVANNSSIAVEGAGEVELELIVENKNSHVTMKNVLYVPDLCANLLSVNQMTKNGNRVVFKNEKCFVYNKLGDLIATASLVDDMYKLDIWKSPNVLLADETEHKIESANIAKMDPMLWHRRLGHVNFEKLNNVREAVDGVDFIKQKFEKCVTCIKGKQSRHSFKNEGTRATKRLEIVHSDICGPISTNSLGGKRYFITFIDDFSRKVFIYFLRTKSEALSKFIDFKTFVEKQTGESLKVLRTDNGGEFCNNDFDQYLQKHGIKHQKTAPYTPQQNGVSERFNRTIVEKTRCMLIDAGLEKLFWAEAASTAVYILNRIPCKGTGKKTPEELWSNKKPVLAMMRVFGCTAMVHIPKEKRKKLDDKSSECIFVGYSDESKAYRLYSKQNGNIIVSRDVIFLEANAVKEKVNDSQQDDFFRTTIIEELVATEVTPDEIEPAVAADGGNESNNQSFEVNANDVSLNGFDENRSEDDTLLSTSELSFADAESTIISNDLIASSSGEDTSYEVQRRSKRVVDQERKLFASSIEMNDPETFKEAIQRADSEDWKRAMADEMSSLNENETWELTDLPEGRKTIDCRWVFKIKRNTDENTRRYKARLVARGFSQKEGIDYTETYSPVVKYTSIRFLLAIAVQYDLQIRQLDAVTAFLNGELEEEIYMVQPVGYNDGSGRVCHLKKSLYGLRQASRAWNEKLNGVLLEAGLNRSGVDHCVYHLMQDNKILIVAVYVDDMLVLSNNDEKENWIIDVLKSQFKMKDLGPVSSVLGMRIVRDQAKGTISIDQEAYATKVLKRFGYFDCNPVTTPLDPTQKLSTSDSPKTDHQKDEMRGVPYQEVIGSLMYLAQLTRPDICYAICFLSRFNNKYGKAHWGALKRVLRYLKGTVGKKLVYKKESDDIHGYSDADWGGDLDGAKSTSGYVFLMQGAAISWCAQTQQTVAIATAEAELASAVAAIQEAIWLQNFEGELFKDASTSTGMVLYCDNKSAIQYIKNKVPNSRMKHVFIKDKFVEEKIKNGDIVIEYVSTNEMAADIFTKAVPLAKFSKFVSHIGLH